MANISQIKLPDNTVYDIKDAGALRTITSSNVTTALGYTPLNANLKGANNGVAELDANGKVPSSQLPSYIDDVLEYIAKTGFPSTGETGKIYVDTTTNKTYRWSGSDYVEISASLALGTTSSTAYRGDYGNAAYAHAVTNKGSAFSSGLYKITTNSEGHVTAATAVAKSDITALGIPGSDTDTHRPIQVNGTQALASNTTALNLKAGSNVTITDGGSGAITIAATDTNTWRPVSDSVSSTSSSDAASSKAVKTAYDLAASKTANTGTVTSVATGVGLTGGTITGSGTLKAKLRSETALTIDSAAATTTSGRVYPVAVDKSGYLAVNVPWTDSKPVTSVNNQTGAVSITPANIGALPLSAGDAAPLTNSLTIKKVAASDDSIRFGSGAGENSDYISVDQSAWGIMYYLLPVKNVSNNTYRNSGFRFFEYSLDTNTGNKTKYYETYRLPNVNNNRTSSKDYDILTSKSPVTIPQGGTNATNAAGARSNLGIMSNTYQCNGLLVTSKTDSALKGYGHATVSIINRTVIVSFGVKIETAGTLSNVYDSGIWISTLKNLNSNLPDFTSVGATLSGTINYYTSSGAINTSLQGYGGTGDGVDGTGWGFGRIHTTSGDNGWWSSNEFTAGLYITGTLYGILT